MLSGFENYFVVFNVYRNSIATKEFDIVMISSAFLGHYARVAFQVKMIKKTMIPKFSIKYRVACFAFWGFSFLENDKITNHATITKTYAPINTPLHSLCDCNNYDAGKSGAVPRISHSIESKMYSFTFHF